MSLLLGLLACFEGSRVTAIVERVDDAYEQVVVTQPGVEGLLPEGTTTLRADASAREGLVAGQVVELEVDRGRVGPEIRSARFLRWADESDGWIVSAGRRVPAERAEPIELFDTAGEPVSLAALAGRVVLVDFIYTSCPGPCPVQTHNMRRVQRGLSETAREHVRLLSVTIDPETDDGRTLAAYADRHGADRRGWSFLTGPVERVEDVRTRYAIGVSDDSSGGMDHTLRSYLIDDRGYLVDRYRSDLFDPQAVVQRLEALAGEAVVRAGG